MRYRQLDSDYDMMFGRGDQNFLANSPASVAQLVRTRLLLLQGEWFVDVTDGVPYSTKVLGKNTTPLYDQVIRQRVLDTDGVVSIDSYSSALNTASRGLMITMTLTTVYGQTVLATEL